MHVVCFDSGNVENGIPVSYIAASDGKLYPYTEESAADPKLQFLIKTYNGDLYKNRQYPRPFM